MTKMGTYRVFTICLRLLVRAHVKFCTLNCTMRRFAALHLPTCVLVLTCTADVSCQIARWNITVFSKTYVLEECQCEFYSTFDVYTRKYFTCDRFLGIWQFLYYIDEESRHVTKMTNCTRYVRWSVSWFLVSSSITFWKNICHWTKELFQPKIAWVSNNTWKTNLWNGA